MLQSLGLGEKDHKVYRALLLHPDWGISDIGQSVGLPELEVRGTLDRLTNLALLHSVSGTERYFPANPEIGISLHLQKVEAELDERRALLSRDRAALAELTSDYAALWRQAETAGVERLDGVEAVRIRLQELSQRAGSEVHALMPGGALSPAALEACRPLDQQNLARGVRLQTVYLDSVRNDHATVEYATWLAGLGGETRTAPVLPLRLIVCDGSVAVIPVNINASSQGAFVIHLRSMVTAFDELFRLIWERASALGEAPPGSIDGPSERDHALLKMLQEGVTDEGMSRKLGVSLRTVRRIMADLMKRLNAQSRFQVGTEAVRRGWI
ncbi:LuxR C-terminal-related transcriptional regulator [Streptomyces virginiae]|uniref:LuxR C-terminal-related transcriptional regulator n=1 Tax=Streptomyces virginiae TaxID=1961 RepID=UPI00352F1840